jgi:SsrA-binding protein
MFRMKTFAENKKAYFNYQILEEFEAGIMLTGPEVKSVRAGQISLKEAFATVRSGEIWLTNAHISAYKPARTENYDPTKSRKLLLNKKEIINLIGKVQEAGNTLLPLKVYDKKGKIKVLLGLGKGKKKYDKREALKKKDQEREIKRALKES